MNRAIQFLSRQVRRGGWRFVEQRHRGKHARAHAGDGLESPGFAGAPRDVGRELVAFGRRQYVLAPIVDLSLIHI